jgi:hypothetical protein
MSVGISIFVGKFKYFSLRYMLSYLPVCTVNKFSLTSFVARVHMKNVVKYISHKAKTLD